MIKLFALSFKTRCQDHTLNEDIDTVLKTINDEIDRLATEGWKVISFQTTYYDQHYGLLIDGNRRYRVLLLAERMEE